MKYLVSTLKYLFIEKKARNMIVFIIFALVPSILVCCAIAPENFVKNINNPPAYANWGELWLSYFRSPRALIVLAIGLLFCILSASLISSCIVYHFRIGKFKLPNVLRACNDYFFPSLFYSLMIVFILALGYTLYTTFAYLWFCTISKIAYTVMCYITLFILLLLTSLTISALTFWYPSMIIRGIYEKGAMLNAFYQSRGKQKVLLPSNLIMTVVVVIAFVIAYFVRKLPFIAIVISAVGIALVFVFNITYTIIVYFGENMLTREDLLQSPYKRR